MRATAVIPVKRFGAAKQRLEVADPALRERLAEAMLADVLAALGRAQELERIIVVSGEPRAHRLAEQAGAEKLDDPLDAGHSEAALAGIAAAIERGAACVALLPGDCPFIDAAELDAALAALVAPAIIVAPDRHGTGTNGLLLTPPDAIPPAFGPGSRERHLQLATEAGIEADVGVSSLALDLDTGDDLAAIRERLRRDPTAAPRTAAVLAEEPARR